MDTIERLNPKSLPLNEEPFVTLRDKTLILNYQAYMLIINGAFSRFFRRKYPGCICVKADMYGFSIFKPMNEEDESFIVKPKIKRRGCLRFDLSKISEQYNAIGVLFYITGRGAYCPSTELDTFNRKINCRIFEENQPIFQ